MSKNYNKYYNKPKQDEKTTEGVKETTQEVTESVEEVEEISEEVEETSEEVEETIEEIKEKIYKIRETTKEVEETVETNTPAPIKLAMVLPDLLNFRSQPTVEDGNVIAVLKKGTDVEFVFSNGTWSTVVFDGKRGYVMSKHIQLRDEE